MKRYALDTECYRDYFLVAWRDMDTGSTFYQEMFEGQPMFLALPTDGTIVTFNGNHYDMPILAMALDGATCEQLKAASDAIIIGGLKSWQVRDKFGGVDLSLMVDHIDLIEVAPGEVGLKLYGGRLNSKRLRDLPIEPDASITVNDRKVLVEYCCNDLETTIDLYKKLEPQIKLRESMSEEFGIDLRSKSDAQIAEAVIRSEVEKRLQKRVYRPEIHPAYTFKYVPPSYITFASDGMKQAIKLIEDATFTLNDKGSVELPRILESMRLRIGNGVYRMGIGGLHSSEACVSHKSDWNYQLIDRDVVSYYPNIILTQGLYPAHMGLQFLEVYRSLVERRIEAKRNGNKVMADALKICVNGSFGKLGSKWSVLYSPDLLIQVTLTGQLALLMLIESLEEAGITVVSANTDGVVSKCPTDKLNILNAIIMAWELVSGLETEETRYSALYSRDVNNYLAIKSDGYVKTKGAYATTDIGKNPNSTICVDAVIKYLTDGTPVEQSITGCLDVRKFLTVRQVKGGALYDGQYLGKAVRWYYAAGEARCIEYKNNGNKVARSDGARPLMELPDSLPSDIDYQFYIDEAKSILADVGA